MELKEKYIPRILLVFVIGGIFGFIYEEIFYRIDLGYFVKRGTTYGPWIPIYGLIYANNTLVPSEAMVRMTDIAGRFTAR